MEYILGNANSLFDYLIVILIYFFTFILLRYPFGRVELNFRTNFKVLFIFWFLAMFAGNYVFFLLGLMSFLPWLNNLLHTFVWVGFCLTYLYSHTRKRSILLQFFLFSYFSFIIKVAENLILGSWNFDPYFFFKGKYAYIIIMSLVDGFYPVISVLVLKLSSRFIEGVYAEK